MISLGSILSIQLFSTRIIMRDLGTRIIERNLELAQTRLQNHLMPAKDLVLSVAAQMKNGKMLAIDSGAMKAFLSGALASAPQIGAMIIANSDQQGVTILRDKQVGEYQINLVDTRKLPEFPHLQADTPRNIFWGRLLYIPATGQSYMNIGQHVWRDGQYAGFVGAAISLQELGNLTRQLAQEGSIRAFILYGEEHILAHSHWRPSPGDVSIDRPAPDIGQSGDLLLQNLSQLISADFPVNNLARGTEFHEITLQGEKYYLLRRQLTGFGAVPLQIGMYRKAEEVDAPLRLFYAAGGAGLLILVLAILVAIAISRRIAAPLRQAAQSAQFVAALEFEQISPMPPGKSREFDQLSKSFNNMVEGLRNFARYSPRNLVRKLMREKRIGAGSEQRELIVMFTDMVGFTSLCETMTAPQVAAFLNRHLALLTDCIESEQGTIDKFIGDSVMAFWGAPEEIADPCQHALQAAQKMRAAIRQENQQRQAKGQKPVGLRVGIHCGQLVVGDIGAPNRINYTVVGDVVNTAQRLEGLGKQIAPQAETVILFSEAMYRQIPTGFATRDHGFLAAKGKQQTVHIYELLAGENSR